MRISKIKVLITLLAVLATFFSCVTFTPFPISYWTKPLVAPDYIISIWPPPESQLWEGYYEISRHNNNIMFFKQTGIHVTILTRELVDEERPAANGNPSFAPFIERVFLYVDGKKIPNDLRSAEPQGPRLLGPIEDGESVYYDLTTRYEISWIPPLSVGTHTAKMLIETASGKILEFEWHFKIK